MTAYARVRLAPCVLAAACLTFLALAGCSSPAPPDAPAPVAVALPEAPPVLLPRQVVEAASIYEDYVQRAVAIDPAFTGGASVAASLMTGETYQAGQLQRGETAYGAIVALQDPTFVANLRAYAINPEARGQMASAIMADPRYAGEFKGGDQAAGLVIAALSDQGQRLLATGAKIRQASYDVQHEAWSKADVVDRDRRLALAKQLSTEQQQAISQDAVRLFQAATGAQPMGLSAPPAPPPYTPLVTRALAVAALAALGEGGEEYSGQLASLLNEGIEGHCLDMAKLNLYQCLAVSKPHYEDMFCLGQHAVADTGQCIMKGALLTANEPDTQLPQAAPAPDVKAGAKKTAHHKKKTTDPSATG